MHLRPVSLLLLASPLFAGPFEDGTKLLERAERAANPGERIERLAEATQRFREAVDAQPGHCAAHARWAEALFAIVRELPDGPELARTTEAARARFVAAVECPGADWRAAYEAGRFHSYRATEMARTTPDRQAALHEARKLFERALTLTREPSETGIVRAGLAACLFHFAHTQATVPETRDWLEQSVAQYRAAHELSPAALGVTGFNLWAGALAQLGQLAGDTNLIRQAAARLQDALALDPRQEQARFNLARCHALLGQPRVALRELETGAGHEPSPAFWRRVAKDPDLASVRALPGYRQLVQTKRADLPAALYQDGLRWQAAAENATSDDEARDLYAKAVADYRRAVELKPDFYDARVILAHCLRQLSELREAETQFAAAAELPAADWRAFYGWGLVLRANGKLERARQVFEQSLTLATLPSQAEASQRELDTIRKELQ